LVQRNKPTNRKPGSVKLSDKSVFDDKAEARLITRVAARDRAAFEQFYGLFYKRLYRFAYRIMGREEGVQEVINDTMYVVWDKARKFDGSSKVSTWVFGIALRKAKTYLTKHGTRRSAGEIVGSAEEGVAPDWQGRLETENWLEAAMEVLSTDQRTVVELTYFHGLHYREIASIMKCPENTVKTRMFHARDKLKTALRQLSRGSDQAAPAAGE